MERDLQRHGGVKLLLLGICQVEDSLPEGKIQFAFCKERKRNASSREQREGKGAAHPRGPCKGPGSLSAAVLAATVAM